MSDEDKVAVMPVLMIKAFPSIRNAPFDVSSKEHAAWIKKNNLSLDDRFFLCDNYDRIQCTLTKDGAAIHWATQEEVVVG